MGLDINIVKGNVHPEFIQRMVDGDTIGCGEMFDGKDIVDVDMSIYYQRKKYSVRDVLKAALNNGSESEYHLLTPERVAVIKQHALTKIAELKANPNNVYYDELEALFELIESMDAIELDISDFQYFAIWG